MDKNHDGTLTRAEIMDYFVAYMSKEEAEEIVRNIDTNENGLVNYTEFVNATIDKKKLVSEDKLK